MLPDIDLTKLPQPKRFVYGQYVLYRDPALYWAGKDGHTFPCRVLLNSVRLELESLLTGQRFKADPDYARLLPAGDCMRDVDEAPLQGEYPDLHPAAVAWLEQNARREVVR
ncbi:hypothetical protein [Streptomyces prasinus]|uniref:hypothetical protein n=1 Tax=Streptomyces prasinus TaxID=67345 RepID=UPI003D9EF09A